MTSRKERDNFVYTNHLKERIKQRGINLEDVKLTMRNPDHERKSGVSVKSIRNFQMMGNIRNELVVIWKWSGKQIIVQTAYHQFIKFK